MRFVFPNNFNVFHDFISFVLGVIFSIIHNRRRRNFYINPFRVPLYNPLFFALSLLFECRKALFFSRLSFVLSIYFLMFLLFRVRSWFYISFVGDGLRRPADFLSLVCGFLDLFASVGFADFVERQAVFAFLRRLCRPCPRLF